MTVTADQVFRDFNTDGVPASGLHKPILSEVRELLGQITATTALGRNVAQNGAVPGGSSALNSAAFNAAADAEIASGTKTLYVNGGDYNISAVTLDKIHSVTLVGTGTVSGTNAYRKQVFHPLTPGPADSYAADVIPAIHMKKLNSAYERTGSINVVLWGDSIGTYKPGPGSARMDLKVEAYRAMLMKQFPNATVNFYDRCIGGKFLSQWDQVDAASNTLYTWYTPGAAWNAIVGALAPDLVIVAFGMNYSNSILEMYDVQTYLNTLSCDVLWETNMIPNLAYASFTPTAIDLRDKEAGMTRSFARWVGAGIIDFHRRCCIARDGFDVRMAHSLEGTKETVSAFSGFCQGTHQAWNWKITAHFDASGWANGATTQLQFILGGGDDYLSVKKSAGGFWTIQWICAGTTLFGQVLVTTAAAASSSATAQMTVEVRDDVVTVYLGEGLSTNVSEEPIYTSRIVRKTCLNTPYVGIATVAGGSLTSADFVYAEQRKNMPLITNKELWDSAYYTADGGINHPTSAGCDMIYLPVLEQINLRADSGAAFFQGLGAATIANTTETVLSTKSILASRVDIGMRGRISALFELGANANTKTIRMKMLGSTIATYTGAQNGGSIRFELDFCNVGSVTFVSGAIFTAAGVTQILNTLTSSLWTAANTFQVTGQNGTATANDIVQRYCIFELMPKPSS